MATTSAPPETSLIPPHGGRLVDRLLTGPALERALERLPKLPRLRLTPRQIADVEMLTTGALSPIEGFMTSRDYRSVIESARLANGTVWPIPVTLGLTEAQRSEIASAEAVALHDGARDLALLQIEEIFAPDPAAEARAVYGTEATAHPGVEALHQRGNYLIGGRLDALDRHAFAEFADRRLSPRQTRELFARRGWRRVVAFQTRNPIHRAHEYLLRCAIEMADGVLIHPLMGATKAGDIPGAVRWACYEALMKHYLPPDRVALSIFPANMHYAGPKEAIYHALVRKNYGCSHLIVGRDHAGVGDYYGTYDAQRIFDDFPPDEIGIEPLKFDNTFYCYRCGGMASFKTCPHAAEDRVVLSGTRVREMLGAGVAPPEEFTRPEIARILIDHYRAEQASFDAEEGVAGPAAASVSSQPDPLIVKPRYEQGFTLWFTGLSGAGKSTLTQRLAPILRARGRTVEVLDGDEVRENLSKGLGFSKEDRDTNIRRIGYVARLLTRHGVVVMTAAISPYKAVRDYNRSQIGNFIEVYVECPLETLVERDVKGLYRRALAGQIPNFTGVSDPYEPPDAPEIHVDTARETVEESTAKIIAYLETHRWLR